jgi:hypothetical protein
MTKPTDPLRYEQNIPDEFMDDIPFQNTTQSTVGPAKSDTAVSQEFFQTTWASREFPDDFLILNDIVMSDIPTNSVSLDSEGGVMVAETLRSRAPVVSATGVQDIILHIVLSFNEGESEFAKLRRLIGELQHHPLVYIYNNKVRKSLGISDPTITTMFILESGTLRPDPDTVGVIVLDLTLHYFNYKPFSHHFWYNTNLPWVNKARTEHIDKIRNPEDLIAYEASDYSLEYAAERLVNDIKNGAIAIGLNNPNVPVNIPSASDAWMYYANYLTEITPAIKNISSDYIGFKLKAYEYHTPPGDAQKAGKGLIGDLFKEEDGTFAPYPDIYNALTEPIYGENSVDTATGIAAKKTVAKESFPEAAGTGFSWMDARAKLFVNGQTPWSGQGELQLNVHLSPYLADESGYVYNYKGASKCNIMFFETLYRSGYKVPLQPRRQGKGYPAIGGMLRQIRSSSLSWGIRLTGRTKDDIQKIVDSGVPVGLVWAKPGHVVIISKIIALKYSAEGTIISITYEGYDQNKIEKHRATRVVEKQLGIEIVQAIPSGTEPPYRNPLGPLDQGTTVNQAIATLEQKAGDANRPQPGEDRTDKAARRKWINELSLEGLHYYTSDPKLRNIFYRNIEFHISSEPSDQAIPLYGKDIVCSTVTLNFGHRIVPQKLVSQDTYTWQFLGAGNKSGTIVFMFAGEQGRASADKIKKIIYRSRENARQFQGLIPDAGAIELNWYNPNGPEQNIFFALLNIRNIVVTDFSESSIPDTSDRHQLVINFIAQDFAEEKLDRNILTTFDQKKRVIRAIMELLIPHEYDVTEERIFVTDKTTRQHVIIPDPQHIVYLGTDQGQWRISPSSSIPGWLAEIVTEAATISTETDRESPALKDVPQELQAMYAEWGADRLIRGRTQNNIMGVKVDINDAVETAWAAGVPAGINQEANSDKFNRIYYQWINQMDILFNRVMRNAMAVDFNKWFGNVGSDTIRALTERIGECYDDMMLPNVPTGNIPLSPDFYIYNDSSEDPAISSLTNDANMEQFLRRHIRNEKVSVKRYIEDTLLGGSYVSKNLPKIIESRKQYLDNFSGKSRKSGEFKWMSFGARLAEGTRAWEPVFYRSADDAYQSDTNKKWIDRISGGKDSDKVRLDFMNSLISLSPYINSGQRGKLWNQPYNKSNEAELVESIFDENWRNSAFGPNPNYRYADEVLSGNIPNSREELAGQQIQKTPSQIQAEKTQKQASEMTGNHVVLKDGSVAFGYTAAEAQAAKDESFHAILSDDLQSFESLFGTLFEFTIPGQVVSLITNLKSNYEEQEKQRALQSEISKVLPDLDHSAMGSKFTPDKEETTVARMANAFGFGSKSNDLSMRRAYPTFKIYLIEEDEEGSEIINGKMVRAFDDFYSSSAVQSIRILLSRKMAAATAVIRITNVGGKILRRRFGESDEYENELKARAGIDAEYETGIFADTEKENPFERMVLQDGVKIQIRLGYDSNPDHLTSAFLGSVVEIQPAEDGKILEIVCQGFGAELEGIELGPLEDGPIFYSSQQVLSGAIIQDSIVNFGRRSNFNRFTSEARHAFTGGRGESLSTILGMPITTAFRAWGESRLFKHYFKYPFKNWPQDDNIYAPPPYVYTSTWERFWNNACTYRPLKQTPWQIFKEHELRHPGYIAMAVPYGHSPRMTMFFGSKSQHYWAFPPSGLELFLAESAMEQIVRLQDGLNTNSVANPKFASQLKTLAQESPGLAEAIIKGVTTFSHPVDVGFELGKLFGRYRPFRNFHYLDSTHHILRNNIRTSRDGTFNEVEVLYFENENDIEEDDAEKLSSNLEALQRGETGVLACKLDENIPEEYIRSYREEFPSCITEDMARRYIQGLFARTLRDCYKGDLYILGNETLKPHDICYINDSSINMTGPIEVEQVEHIFDRDLGFISIITPDLCVDINDYYSATVLDLVGSSMAYTWGLDDPNTVVTLSALASPMAFLAWTAGVKFIKWTQEGVPVVTTPLTLEGKPFMSVTLGQKRTSLVMSLHGRWRQYWDDLANAWNKFDVAESMFDSRLNWSEKVIGFISNTDAGESIPEADY